MNDLSFPTRTVDHPGKEDLQGGSPRESRRIRPRVFAGGNRYSRGPCECSAGDTLSEGGNDKKS